jgi:hypothetical protein
MEAGQNLEAVPHLGWATAVPDAPATGDRNVKRSALKFEGVCRHDKVSKKLIVSQSSGQSFTLSQNWVDVPMASAVYI